MGCVEAGEKHTVDSGDDPRQVAGAGGWQLVGHEDTMRGCYNTVRSSSQLHCRTRTDEELLHGIIESAVWRDTVHRVLILAIC